MSYLFKKLPKFDIKELDGKTLKIRVVKDSEDGDHITLAGMDVENNHHYIIVSKRYS